MVPGRARLRSLDAAAGGHILQPHERLVAHPRPPFLAGAYGGDAVVAHAVRAAGGERPRRARSRDQQGAPVRRSVPCAGGRSEEHTSELQSLMRISYAVFCLKKTRDNTDLHTNLS